MVIACMVFFLQDGGTPSNLHDVRETHLQNVVQLTNGGENAEAYWDVSGKRIIYQSTQPEYADEQIYLMNADGSGRQLVSTGKGRCTCGYFVPGTNDVIYSSTDWIEPGAAPKPDMSQGYVWMVNPNFRIFRQNLDTGQRQMLINRPGYQAETTVSPDGSFMVFTSTMDGDLDIYRANLQGNDLKRLTHEPGYDGGPFVSWDGKQIVYRRATFKDDAAREDYFALLRKHLVRPSKLEIWIMDSDGSNKRQVTNLGVASFAPFLHPNGRQIIFSSNYGDPKGREFDLFVINVDGTDLKRITYTPEFDGFPMFNREGTKLIWSSNRNGRVPGETNIFVADWKP